MLLENNSLNPTEKVYVFRRTAEEYFDDLFLYLIIIGAEKRGFFVANEIIDRYFYKPYFKEPQRKENVFEKFAALFYALNEKFQEESKVLQSSIVFILILEFFFSNLVLKDYLCLDLTNLKV